MEKIVSSNFHITTVVSSGRQKEIKKKRRETHSDSTKKEK